MCFVTGSKINSIKIKYVRANIFKSTYSKLYTRIRHPDLFNSRSCESKHIFFIPAHKVIFGTISQFKCLYIIYTYILIPLHCHLSAIHQVIWKKQLACTSQYPLCSIAMQHNVIHYNDIEVVISLVCPIPIHVFKESSVGNFTELA